MKMERERKWGDTGCEGSLDENLNSHWLSVYKK